MGSTKVVVNEARKENYNRANIFPKKTGSYVITYAATDASGNMAMCRNPGQTKLQTAQNSAYRAATQNNGNPFLSLMAESTTTVNMDGPSPLLPPLSWVSHFLAT